MKYALIFLCELIICTYSNAIGFVYSRIDTRITNETNEIIDVYCQSSDPWYKCHHDEPCIISSWPVVHLQPGETKQTPLWISNSEGSQVKLSFFSSMKPEYQSADLYTLSKIESGANNHGYVLINMGSMITQEHSANVGARLHSDYSSKSLTLSVS